MKVSYKPSKSNNSHGNGRSCTIPEISWKQYIGNGFDDPIYPVPPGSDGNLLKPAAEIRLPDSWVEFLTFSAAFRLETAIFLQDFAGNTPTAALRHIILGSLAIRFRIFGQTLPEILRLRNTGIFSLVISSNINILQNQYSTELIQKFYFFFLSLPSWNLHMNKVSERNSKIWFSYQSGIL